MTTTIAEMTIEEFQSLIENVIEKKFTEWLADFDEDFELTENVRERLLQQKK
jgi:hypothetical protein